MARSLQGASVVVIGGSSGIGLATARLALDAGAEVTIAGRDEARLAAAGEELGGAVRRVAVDAGDEPAVEALFDEVGHVDHVATFAGSFAPGNLADVDTETLRGPVDSRFWGALYVCKHAAPRMTDGSITICTGAGVGRPRAGNAIVSAAAGGSEVLAKAMAVELAPVRVNVVRPGIVDTPLLEQLAPGRPEAVLAQLAKRIPLRRVAQPEEIADGVLFLMANAYVTGTILTIDGGFSVA